MTLPAQQALLVAISASVYWVVFRLNAYTDDWTMYDQGIHLIFLPAGVKHLAILLARGWGALGCGLALFWLSFEFWQEASLPQLLGYTMVSTLASWLGVMLGLRLLQVQGNLANLRFWHLPVMDLVTTGVHAMLVNAFFMMAAMKSEHWLENVLAMMLGDYIGSFIILVGLWGTLLAVRTVRRHRLKTPPS